MSFPSSVWRILKRSGLHFYPLRKWFLILVHVSKITCNKKCMDSFLNKFSRDMSRNVSCHVDCQLLMKNKSYLSCLLDIGYFLEDSMSLWLVYGNVTKSCYLYLLTEFMDWFVLFIVDNWLTFFYSLISRWLTLVQAAMRTRGCTPTSSPVSTEPPKSFLGPSMDFLLTCGGKFTFLS